MELKKSLREISIAKFYGGKSILITGATGFMGKVMVEKLLRDCRDVKCIYILVRMKRGGKKYIQSYPLSQINISHDVLSKFSRWLWHLIVNVFKFSINS